MRDRDRKFLVPKVLRHSLAKYGELSRIDGIEKRWPQNGWDGKISCPENPSAIPLSVERQFCIQMRLFDRRSKNFTVPHPLAISFI